MRFAYGVTTWGGNLRPWFKETLSHIPTGSRVEIVDNSVSKWSLAKAWNAIADKLLWDETYDACIIMNDDVVLRPETGELLAWGLLEGQFQDNDYDDYWHTGRPELLLLSARHAAAAVCTDA